MRPDLEQLVEAESYRLEPDLLETIPTEAVRLEQSSPLVVLLVADGSDLALAVFLEAVLCLT